MKVYHDITRTSASGGTIGSNQVTLVASNEHDKRMLLWMVELSLIDGNLEMALDKALRPTMGGAESATPIVEKT